MQLTSLAYVSAESYIYVLVDLHYRKPAAKRHERQTYEADRQGGWWMGRIWRDKINR